MVRRDDVVFREGERDAVYVVEAGCFDVRRYWRGEDFWLRELGVGEWFGEMALIDC